MFDKCQMCHNIPLEKEQCDATDVPCPGNHITLTEEFNLLVWYEPQQESHHHHHFHLFVLK